MGRDEVRAAVARRVERTIIQGAIQLRGRRWSCEELWQYTHDKVLVCDPVYHAPAELLVLDMKGNRLGIATPMSHFIHLIIVAPKARQHEQRRTAMRLCRWAARSRKSTLQLG